MKKTLFILLLSMNIPLLAYDIDKLQTNHNDKVPLSVKSDKAFLLKRVQHYALALKNANSEKKLAQDLAQNRLYSSLMQKAYHANSFLKQPTVAKHYFAQAVKESITTLQENNARISMNFINAMKLDAYFIFDQNTTIDNNENDTLIFKHYFHKNRQDYDVWNNDMSMALKMKDNKLMVFKTINKKSLFTIKHKNEITGAIFDNNMSKILSISQTKDEHTHIKVTDINTKTELYTHTYSDVQKELISFSEDSSKLLIPDINNSILIIDANTGKKTQVIDLTFNYHNQSNVQGIDEIKMINNIIIYLFSGFTHNESMLIASDINTQESQLLNQSCYEQSINIEGSVLYSIANCNSTGGKSSVESWYISDTFPFSYSNDIYSTNKEAILDIQHMNSLNFITLYNRVLVLDDTSNDILYDLHHKTVSKIMCSRDRRKIITYSTDNTMKIWIDKSLESTKLISKDDERDEVTPNKLEISTDNIDQYKIDFKHAVNEEIVDVILSPNPENIFIITYEKIYLWDIQQKKLLYDFTYISYFNSIKFTKDKKMFLVHSGSFGIDEIQGGIQVRDFKSGEKILNIHLYDDEPQHINFVNNDQWIHYNDHNYFYLWDIHTRKNLMRLKHIDYDDYDTNYQLVDSTLQWVSKSDDVKYNYTLDLFKNANIPKDKLPSLMTSNTGTTLNKLGEIKLLSLKEWQKAKSKE